MKKKIVWVTGASTGIGREIAKKFAKEDCIVVVSGRRKSRLVSLVSEIKFAGKEAFAFVSDVSSERSVQHIYKKIKEHCGYVDVLINNAGVTVFKSFLDTKIFDYDYIMDINTRGTFLCTKIVLPQMIKNRCGHIINIISVAANTIFDNSSIYSASKAAVVAMTNVLRKEVRKYNIKITNIYPGPVDTPIWDTKTRLKYKKRMMQPKDVAEIVYEAFSKSGRNMIEDIYIRPQKGDLT